MTANHMLLKLDPHPWPGFPGRRYRRHLGDEGCLPGRGAGAIVGFMAADRLKVIVNDRCLRNVRTGVGHYVAELLAALPAVDPALDVKPFYQRLRRGRFVRRAIESHARGPAPSGPYEPPPDGRGSDVGRGPAIRRGSDVGGAHVDQGGSGGRLRRPPAALRRWMQAVYELAFEAFGPFGGCRLYHEPNHIPGPWQGPIVTTVHDLSVLRHPEWHPADRVAWYERDFLAALPRSEHFIAVSAFTRQEMIDLLDLAPERISVIHLGVRGVFQPRPREQTAGWLARRGLPARYLLFAGTLEPRKNVEGLLSAYARLPGRLRERFPLLLAGAGGWGDDRLDGLTARMGLSGQVRRLGYVTDEELAWLYAGAAALVWPTLYEGFGLPPLECLASGTPVITSRRASLPEVVGEAGLLVDPRDPAEIASAIERVIEDVDFAQALTRRGLMRAKEFSWLRCAEHHAAIYRRFADA